MSSRSKITAKITPATQTPPTRVRFVGWVVFTASGWLASAGGTRLADGGLAVRRLI